MLHHVEIYVSDLKTSRAFYDFLLTKLGYSLYQEWDKGLSYKKSRAVPGLCPNAKGLPRGRLSPVPYRSQSSGLSCGTPDEIDQWRQEFLTRRVKLLYDDRYPHAGGSEHYALYLEDPDGIKIELVGEMKGAKKHDSKTSI